MFDTIPWPVVTSLFITVIIVGTAFVLGKIVKVILSTRVTSLIKNTRWKWNEILLLSAIKTIVPISVVIGVLTSVKFWNLEGDLYQAVNNIAITFLIMAIVYFLVTATTKAILIYGAVGGPSVPAATLTKNIINTTILILGFLAILHQFGVSITPLLTAVGVGGIAVALALQETLSNLFAGIYVSLAGQIRSGDYIKLDSGEEGFVADISWRETRLKMRDNNLINIPNGRLAKAIFINYNLPELETLFSIDVGVDYESDLEHVERVVEDVANHIQTTMEDTVKDFSPRIRFREFADSGVKVRVVLAAKNYESHFLLRHEFIKQLHKRFKQEDIAIPSSMHLTVHKLDLKEIFDSSAKV